MSPVSTFAVVIPHLNQPEMLARCLESLALGRKQPDEVVVVDNGSRTLPTEVVARYRGARLICERRPGPGPARNAGVQATSASVLAFIDADCLADPGWLAAAESELADPEATILGGDVRIALTDPSRLTPLEAYESEYAYRMDRYIAREGFTGTGNLVVRREVLDDVGPFRGLDVAEDRDWGQRASAKGYRIRYVAAMRVYHPARADLREIFAKWDRHTAHDYVLAKESRSGLARFALKALAMGVSPLAELPRLVRSDRVTGWRSKAVAFGALTQVRWHRLRRMAWLLAGGDPARLSGAWNRDG